MPALCEGIFDEDAWYEDWPKKRKGQIWTTGGSGFDQIINKDLPSNLTILLILHCIAYIYRRHHELLSD